MNTITFEGVNFNADHLAGFTQKDFINEFINHPKVFAEYSATDRVRLLKDVHKRCKEVVGKEVPPAENSPDE